MNKFLVGNEGIEPLALLGTVLQTVARPSSLIDTPHYFGRPGRNRTFVDWLKARYSTIELRAHTFLPINNHNII